MNSLVLSSKLVNSLFKVTPRTLIAVRNHWNKDFKPRPYPHTEEERAKAAARYGIPLAEYKPYADNGSGLGDYPELPLESVENKDPFYPYDIPALKRNFNEPIHVDYETYREDRVNISPNLPKPISILVLQFLSVMAVSLGLFYFFEDMKMFHPVTPPQKPSDGRVYYTFEKCE
ncbi:NADH dehydrogenase [ubiquinone] 1 beta subcomplex subunit 8, mitochondrial [Sitophilus oryzae]|uniref:NADH dehydrogenase [ubiquinone] 1 beta subcomplex subunit 8, mitochondrial n=1 Tax=Sitophilus oryzae TaxID=7048 RepID=A0A6J2XLZ2_SITOR|nr:NADH dehydrogenase [ubiquinone] 1 beta subcomplex subunit 8, mitochondrial [Sitophilus oryzae]